MLTDDVLYLLATMNPYKIYEHQYDSPIRYMNRSVIKLHALLSFLLLVPLVLNQ